MNKRTIWFAIIALLVCNDVYGKKAKKNKRPKDNEDLTTIQPNVIAYSTFGVNDVGSYNGFVPTAPEYSNYPSNNNQDSSSTRLYAPAFPSAVDSTGLSENYGSQKNEEQTYVGNEKGTQYTPNSIYGDQNKNSESENNANDSDAPRYGTKLGNKYKHRPSFQIENFELETSNRYLQPSDKKYYNFNEMQQTQEKSTLNEPSLNNENTNSFKSNDVLQKDVNDYTKPDASHVQNKINFPRVVDFTKLGDEYYPTELDTSKIMSDSLKHSNTQMSIADFEIGNSFGNTGNTNKFADDSSMTFQQRFNLKNNEDTNEKTVFKTNTLLEPSSKKHLAQHQTYDESSIKKVEQKRKTKYKPWDSVNYSNSYTDGKNSSSFSSMHGYGYSNNYSNMNFKYGVSDPKKPYFQDELLPASSNIVDFTSYQFLEKDNDYKKRPEFNNEGDYFGSPYKNKFQSSDYSNKFKTSLNNAPSAASSHWGSIFKTTDYSSFGEHPKKSPYNVNDIINDDVVNIPKRPQKLFTKFAESKPIEWSYGPYTSQKLNKPTFDWTKDLLDTRYKSEEDLLNLRTHDTSRPSYIPNYNDFDNFKQLSEKWRENYIKSKYKDTRDNIGYWSEKPDYVPIATPHQIEVPHPVIVPVPRPFPVRVPISKPVAVPVLQELTVPIEKPVPYPVYKNVPYPVEKLIPVPVEKEVPYPVDKPYPVHIPHVRPVFHHTKPVYEDPESLEGEDYLPRPEFRKPSQYKKKLTYSSRYRTRRPTRASYQERNRRRWPDRRRPSTHTREIEYTPRPHRYQHSTPNRPRDYDHEADEDEYRSYSLYCKKTGKC